MRIRFVGLCIMNTLEVRCWPSHNHTLVHLVYIHNGLIPIQNMYCNPTHFGDSRRFDSCGGLVT